MVCVRHICLKCEQNWESQTISNINILVLPNEMLLKIFSYLNIKDLNVCAKVSRKFQEISMDNTLILNRHLQNLKKISQICQSGQIWFDKFDEGMRHLKNLQKISQICQKRQVWVDGFDEGMKQSVKLWINNLKIPKFENPLEIQKFKEKSEEKKKLQKKLLMIQYQLKCLENVNYIPNNPKERKMKQEALCYLNTLNRKGSFTIYVDKKIGGLHTSPIW